MSRGAAALLAVSVAALLGGCALGTTTVKVGYDEAKAARGPLSAVGSRRIQIEVTDRRPEPDKIGYKRNAYNDPLGTLVTGRPVRDIVEDALAAELRKNSHLVVAGEADRILQVNVREFWFDMRPGFWTVRLLGTASITMTVAEGRTGNAVLTRDYQGSTEEHSGFGLDWERIMNTALERMMRDVATDPRLVEALRGP